MSESNTGPYYHQEIHTVEGEQYKLTVKVHSSGFREMIIQKVNNHKMVGTDQEGKTKRTWIRDWTNYK